MWKDAQSAFGSGDYAGAAKSLQTIIQTTATASQVGTEAAQGVNGTTFGPAPPNRQWLEPVYYLLGAAYFNAKDWPNAISTFNSYRQLFPKSPRLAQVIFSLAQADLLGGHPDDSITLFTSLLPLSNYHQNALLLLVEANKRANKLPDAVSLLETEIASPNVNPDFLGKIRIKLLAMYLDSDAENKAVSLLQEIDEDIGNVPDVTEFNALAVKLGDLLLAKNQVPEALNCYRRVRDNDQILALQKQQIVNLQQQRAANMASIQANPLNSDQLQLDNKAIDTQIATDQKILTRYQTLPPVLPPLFLRIGRAYSSNGDQWESAVMYRELLRRWPHCAEEEAALYGSIVAFDRVKQVDRAQSLCQAYLTQFPNGKYIDSVGYLHGVLAYDAEDYDKALTYFEDSLRNKPNNPWREQIELILGGIKLRQQKFDEAIAAFKQYETDFPQGQYLEQAEYRSDLALLFGGKAEQADGAFRAYLQKYPQGAYVADAEYRLAVIKFAAKEYAEVIADCQTWQQKHPDSPTLAEVLSLMGDSYESLDKHDEAVKAYIGSVQSAQTIEVLNYSIFAAAKIMQKQARWADIVKMFQDFIAANPDHPTVVSGIFWIGRADVKLGKVEEAKQYMATTAKQYLNDPSREGVDEIITQLAQLYARRHLAFAPPPAAAGTPAPVTTSTSAPVSTPTPDATPAVAAAPADEDPAKSLEDALTTPDLDSKPTAQARILYAKAELARLQHKPDVELQFLLDIAGKFKPEDLSPILLGQVGDALVQNGQPDQADPFYHYVIDEYDQSPVVDYGYNGLGQIAYAKKDYATADKYFFKALDKGLASTKLKEITLGEAQTLLALNRLEDARPYFEQVASTRAWRGEVTALSVFSLGEIQMGQGKYAEANAYYQRVYVAYQKYPDIQAKAYLKSGEAFEKLGKIPEAINTYAEMTDRDRNPNLASFPETTEAAQRLQHLRSLTQK